jgi:hypothetical protein
MAASQQGRFGSSPPFILELVSRGGESEISRTPMQTLAAFREGHVGFSVTGFGIEPFTPAD